MKFKWCLHTNSKAFQNAWWTCFCTMGNSLKHQMYAYWHLFESKSIHDSCSTGQTFIGIGFVFWDDFHIFYWIMKTFFILNWNRPVSTKNMTITHDFAKHFGKWMNVYIVYVNIMYTLWFAQHILFEIWLNGENSRDDTNLR